jgi:Spy/CpxP family protein refolding chaperone
MRFSVRWLLAAACVAVAPAPVFAQRYLIMLAALEKGMGSPILLTNPGVQREIKLTEEQRDKFRAIVKEVGEKYEPDLEKVAADRDKKKMLLVGYKFAKETADKVNKAIPDVLQPEQAKRLRQIEIQVNGIISLNKSDIQKRLDLTDKQREEIKEIGNKFKREVVKVVNDTADSVEQSRPLLAARRVLDAYRTVRVKSEVATEKALALLTDGQRKTWNEMTGANFAFKIELPIGQLRKRLLNREDQS